MASISANKAEKYISGVSDGSIIASKLVRLACERHRRDLTNGHERNLSFSQKHAQHVIDFIQSFCCHSQGEWSGQKFKLEPWQQALLWIAYGWCWADTGYRRFKFCYIELAKGNGKSMIASALGVYELVASNEPGAEVYSVATKKDQARIVFNEAERMVSASPDLKKRIKSYRDSLFLPNGNGAKFQPLSSDEDFGAGRREPVQAAESLQREGSVWRSKAGESAAPAASRRTGTGSPPSPKPPSRSRRGSESRARRTGVTSNGTPPSDVSQREARQCWCRP